jgi:hypothetical protein
MNARQGKSRQTILILATFRLSGSGLQTVANSSDRALVFGVSAGRRS